MPPNPSNNLDIQATQFSPSDDSGKGQKFSKRQIVLGLLSAFVIATLWFLFTSKSVQIRLSPAAQSVSISGGFSIALGGIYLLRQGSYKIEAVSELHEPLEMHFDVDERRNQLVEFQFTPLPGFMTFTIAPEDAHVDINGVRANISGPLTLAAGPQAVTIAHPRYQTWQETVNITGKKIHQTLTVDLAPNWAEVGVTSTPSGAEIFIDGEATGQSTPSVIEALAGEREISLALPGHKTHRQRILAQAGLPMKLAPISLVQADAQLKLTSSPSGAGITVNGQFMGSTPTQLDVKSAQELNVSVILNGYANFNQTLQLNRGQAQSLHADLQQLEGAVVIRTQPTDAWLTVDNQLRGAANQTLNLPIRAHQIAIGLEGYAGYSQTITPKVGLTQEIKVKLLTLAEARLKALKPTISSFAGQNLKLFQPGEFTMGASRREPGRRANETLRTVSMSKLFYMSTHEVTNGQFRQYAAGHDSGAFETVSLNEDTMPVTSVSWHEAAAYCNWLSVKDQLPEFYNIEYGKVKSINSGAIGYRLPTEAEWAWAARTWPVASNPSDQTNTALRFPWGDNLPPPDRHGNYADRAASRLVGRVIFGYNDNQTAAAPVGTFKPNQRGLFDLGGNVAEWTHDFYHIPSNEPVTDPIGPATGEYHVMRGSSWMHGTVTELRYSFRDYGITGRQDVGFRIARYAE